MADSDQMPGTYGGERARERAAALTSIVTPESAGASKWGRRTGRTMEIVILTAIALIFISPILWTISTSLRTPAEAFQQPAAVDPDAPGLEQLQRRVPERPFLPVPFQ